MPPPSHRKKPFSSKQKKRQLQEKREKKHEFEAQFNLSEDESQHDHRHSPVPESRTDTDEIRKLNWQPISKEKGSTANRFNLHFKKESKKEIEKRKLEAMAPLHMLSEQYLEVDLHNLYQPGSVLDMPKRPPWKYTLSKHALEERELTYFQKYLEDIYSKFPADEISYFELNLETWRQLWRVLEMSDIVLLITDIRHPALHFSPALYDYVTKELHKSLILVLNKVDMVSPALVTAWKYYFQENFPNVHIVCFTSYPKDFEERSMISNDPSKLLSKRRKKGKPSAVGTKGILLACEAIVEGKVDLSTWQTQIDDLEGAYDDGSHPEEQLEEVDVSFTEHEAYRDGVLTIGCCGYPNVGKSTVINALVGRKVVSVSKTPGHTKHFQTIYLSDTVKLCDSPGLVFPSLIPKPMQILAGIYPVAQVREPYTAVGYLAQRIHLPAILRLQHPDANEVPTEHLRWSAHDICEAWALKCGYLTAQAGRPDVYRAANSILRLAVEGRLLLCMRPPGFASRKDYWESHPDTTEIASLQDLHTKQTTAQSESESASDDSLPEQHGRQFHDTYEESEEDIPQLKTSNPYEMLADD